VVAGCLVTAIFLWRALIIYEDDRVRGQATIAARTARREIYGQVQTGTRLLGRIARFSSPPRAQSPNWSSSMVAITRDMTGSSQSPGPIRPRRSPTLRLPSPMPTRCAPNCSGDWSSTRWRLRWHLALRHDVFRHRDRRTNLRGCCPICAPEGAAAMCLASSTPRACWSRCWTTQVRDMPLPS
jgi:hypothetical protein